MLNNNIYILVWGKNEHKINWTKLAFKDFIPPTRSLDIKWMDAKSQIASMPLSIKETMLWAKNRALNLMKLWSADFYVWIEWWAWKVWQDTQLWCFAYIQNSNLKWYFWQSDLLIIPPIIAQELYESNKDLLNIMKEKYNKSDPFISQGDVSWFFTNGELTRKVLVYQSVLSALIQFKINF
jgi:non-canonical (house-cleaning) NTP pyrophosphatase